MNRRLILAVTLVVAALAVAPAGAGAKSVNRLVTEHLAALHECDADGLVAGYTRNAKLFFPGGTVVEGRAALQDLYADFVKPQAEGGLCGLRATPVDRYTRGRTTFVLFRVTAPFLAAPYMSTDAYVFRGDKIASEVSTFDATKLQFVQPPAG